MSAKLLNRNLFYARAYFFSYMGGWGFILPFINLFYVGLGLSGAHIGTLGSLSAVVSLIVSPVVVTEIKKSTRARSILQLCLLLGAAGYYLLGQQTIFTAILVIIFLHSLVTAGIMPTSDSMAVSVAQESGSGYGSVRVWASVGWIVSVLSAGWLIERFDFGAGFLGVASMWVLGAGLLLFIHPEFFDARKDIQLSKPSLQKAVKGILHDRTLLGFGIAVILIGFMNNGVLQFENVFLAELGASKQLISVAGILSAIVELPFMIVADRFVRRAGAHPVMVIALAMIFLQRAAVFCFPSIAAIMIVRFLGGISFSFYTISYVGLISSRTQPSETGTVLALYTVTLSGLVNMLAAPTAGLLFDAFGAQWLYALAMMGYAAGALALWITRPFLAASRKLALSK